MKVSETKKQNKYAALITYVIAAVCLLAGLFVPLFNGTGILAMSIPDVINHIIGSDVIEVSEKLDLVFSVNLFGTGTVIDVMAYVILLYAFITLLSLLAFIPIIIAFVKNKGEVISVFAYIIEVAAVLVLSVYLFTALQLMPDTALSYNMLIALGGSLLAVVTLSLINKGAPAALKILLFILSAAGVLSLFNYVALFPELAGIGETVKLYPSFFSYEGMDSHGIGFLSALFGYGGGPAYGETLAALTEVKFKAAYVLATIAGLAVMVNYFIDVIGLTSNAKRTGLLFNLVRYGFEFIAVVCLIITVLVCSFNMGLFLVVLAATALIRVGISVLRFILALKRAKEEKENLDESEQTIRFAKPAKAPKVIDNSEKATAEVAEQPAPFVGAEPIEITEQPVGAEKTEEPVEEQMAFIEPAPSPAAEEQPEEAPAVVEHPGEVQMQMPENELPPIEEEEEEIPTVHSIEQQLEAYDGDETEEYDEDDEEEIPTVQSVTDDEEEPDEPLQPLQPLEPLQPLNSTDEQPHMIPLLQPLPPLQPLQPVEPVAPVEPVQAEPVQSAEPVRTEPVQSVEPVRTEPVKPVEPVRTEPVQSVEPVRTEPVKPVEPVRTEPVQPVEPVRTEPVQPVEPVRTEPVQKQPAEQPFTIVDDGRLVYTIRYGGPTDEFINKLTNDEKIEFAMTFIEKGKGDIGNIPEYVIGGNNKKFFSAVFIYLGRVRGMISDGLLNKMFKELNML